MKFEHYQKRVEDSKEYKTFVKKHPKAKLCAGFFIKDFEAKKDVHQLDYILPNGRIATFALDEKIILKMSEQEVKKKLPYIEGEIKTDLDALRGIVQDEMKNRTVTEDIKKIIAVLHVLDEKVIWNLQCILNGLGVLNVHVDDSDQSILKFERYSLMDMVRKIPGNLQANLQKNQDKPNVKVIDTNIPKEEKK